MIIDNECDDAAECLGGERVAAVVSSVKSTWCKVLDREMLC